jgi:trimeric autotransporter adhesin
VYDVQIFFYDVGGFLPMAGRSFLAKSFIFMHLPLAISAAMPATKPSQECAETRIKPMRIAVSHIEGGGIGYNQGYTSLEGFFSPVQTKGFYVPFLDLRGHIFNDGKMAANAGMGMRYISDSIVYGANAYYDYRNTKHQHYNQIALGLEILGQIYDFRINGYLPIGQKTSSFFNTEFEEFTGNFLMLSRKREGALKGANAEVGYHLNCLNQIPVYFAVGPYYLTGSGNTTWGGEAKLSLNFFDYVSLTGQTSYDSLFHWRGQGQLSLTIPFGSKRARRNSSCAARCLNNRSLQDVSRFEIIPVDRQTVRSKAIDPATGQPYIVWFVDNTSHSSGTYENPFSTLTAAQNASGPNEIIYVFPGDQTTTGLDNGIIMKNGQRLWGAGIEHNLPSTVGTIHIPALLTGPFINNTFNNSIALLPIITGPANVVTLAGNNEISGLYILFTAGNGISGTAVSNLSIEHNTIQGFSGEPIALNNFGGSLLINNNTISAGPMNSAIDISNATSNLNATISNNQILAGADGCLWTVSNRGTLQFTGNAVNAEFNALNLNSVTGSTLTATVANNQMVMFQSGVLLTAGGDEATLTLRSNFIDGGGNASAVEVDHNTGSLTTLAVNNQIMNYGIGFHLNMGGPNATITLQSNIINPGSGNSDPAPAIQLDQTAGSLIALIEGNQSAAGYQGVLLNAGGTDVTIAVNSNTFTNYFGHSIDLQHTTGSLTATAFNNTLFSQDDNGFNYENSMTALTAALSVQGNTIDAYQAISIAQTVGSVNYTLTDNTLRTNFQGPAIVSILNVVSGLQTGSIVNNSVTQSNGDGFDFFFYNAGEAIWNIYNNRFYATAGNAVKISTNTTPGVNASICVAFDNNTAYPIQLGGQGTYLLDNTGNSGSFTLNPPLNNIGLFTTTGVTTGSCP